MLVTKAVATCLLLAAQTYNIPPAVLIGIMQVEGGQVGQSVGPNVNGSYDLGPMQINTVWVPQLAEYWNVDQGTAYTWVRDDACTNIGVAAWILRSHYDDTQSLSRAIAHYHSKTPKYGYAYRERVVSTMRKNGLIRASTR
ncbi:MAG: lytic transglycosylase domain-containing protein [Pseudobdellovibrionaceae bacterium]